MARKNKFEFIDELQDKYLKHLEKAIIPDTKLKSKFIELVKEGNYSEKCKIWNEGIKLKIEDLSYLKLLANPFYLGFGNPEAEILIIGKEKAFDIYEKPNLFFHESINNLYYWEKILQKKLDWAFSKDCEFDFIPIFPQLKIRYKISPGHTWRFYAKLIALIYENSTVYKNYLLTHNYSESFFSKVFATELNYQPSRYSPNRKVEASRLGMFSEKFFKGFKLILFTGKSYLLPDYQDKISKTFDMSFIEEKIIDKKKIDVFGNMKQKLILTDQLSGVAGWSAMALIKLANECRSILKMEYGK